MTAFGVFEKTGVEKEEGGIEDRGGVAQSLTLGFGRELRLGSLCFLWVLYLLVY